MQAQLTHLPSMHAHLPSMHAHLPSMHAHHEPPPYAPAESPRLLCPPTHPPVLGHDSPHPHMRKQLPTRAGVAAPPGLAAPVGAAWTAC